MRIRLLCFTTWYFLSQQSWVDKMITRVRNVVKRDKIKQPNSAVELPDAKRK